MRVVDFIRLSLSGALVIFFLPSSGAIAAHPLPPDPSQWVCANPEPTQQEIEQWCADNKDIGQAANLGVPGPGTLLDLKEKNAYDLKLREFYENRDYAEQLNWAYDKNWRLTGPIVGDLPQGEGQAQFEQYGVHPAVRIYYSPEMVEWLCGGRQDQIKDGAMIVKEMLSLSQVIVNADDQQCMALDQAQANQLAAEMAADDPDDPDGPKHRKYLSWAVMVKAKEVSLDGWYWSSPNHPPKGNPPILDESAVTQDNFFGASQTVTRDPTWYPTGELFQALANGQTKKPDVVYPYNSYGAYCVNCHASAQSESTYSSLDNILTTGMQYKHYPYDSPKSLLSTLSGSFHTGQPDRAALFAELKQAEAPSAKRAEADAGYHNPYTSPLAEPSKAFVSFYDMLEPPDFNAAIALRLPAETYDHWMSGPEGPGQFLTSDQCIGCHDATQNNSATPNMLISDTDNALLTDAASTSVNFSPYGEWRVSPMGLAGRDPIFFSQLQSETNTLPELSACIQNTCLHCHGVMGQRAYTRDNPDPSQPCKELFAVPPPPSVPFGKPFARTLLHQWQGTGKNPDAKYGALARDGISCTVCHHIADQDLGQQTSFTGNFVTSPSDTLFGPFEDKTIIPKPMEQALGLTPTFGHQVTNSDMCGTCHNILLPVFNNDGTPHPMTINGQTITSTYEQTSHLEWTNSDFAKPGDGFQSCQDCHMQNHYPTKKGGQQRLTNIKIANIEDAGFAPTTHSLPAAEITLTPRDDFGRHALHGLNIFLNQMFQQFPLILGLRQIDYMVTGSAQPALITGQNSMLHMAKDETASVAITNLEQTDGQLTATVLVTNKAGHYLPSGVGFRRVFLEFVAEDREGTPLWASGRTNGLGVILNGIGDDPLPSENVHKNPKLFQPHYEQISRGDQVQIYQEVVLDSAQNVTTSFLRRVSTKKDNRLRPKGYDPQVFRNNPSPYIQELGELHGVQGDPYYSDPQKTGADQITYSITLPQDQLAKITTVRATLYSQSIPPFYLQQRFEDAHKGPAEKDDIQRLYYLTSHLDTAAHIESWKLPLAGAEKTR